MLESTVAAAQAMIDGIRVGDLDENTPSVRSKLVELEARLDRELSALNWARSELGERDTARPVLKEIYNATITVWAEVARILRSANLLTSTLNITGE